MALYHLSAQIIGRSAGKSAVAAAAYRSTSKIIDKETGLTHDFSKKQKALYSEILANEKAPEWVHNRAELWNSVQEKENRKNSQFAREYNIALQKELSLQDNIACVKKWADDNYISRGLIGDLAIHPPHEGGCNVHAHIMITTRAVDSQGWTTKDREVNSREYLEKVRKSWADIVNEKFKERGLSERIDHRTLEAQGIDREPQQHMGVVATAMERKGLTPDRQRFKPTENLEQELETNLKTDIDYMSTAYTVELLQKDKDQKSFNKTKEKYINVIFDKTRQSYYSKNQGYIKALGVAKAKEENLKLLELKKEFEELLKNRPDEEQKESIFKFKKYKDFDGKTYSSHSEYLQAHRQKIQKFNYEMSTKKQEFEEQKQKIKQYENPSVETMDKVVDGLRAKLSEHLNSAKDLIQLKALRQALAKVQEFWHREQERLSRRENSRKGGIER